MTAVPLIEVLALINEPSTAAWDSDRAEFRTAFASHDPWQDRDEGHPRTTGQSGRAVTSVPEC
ncbi:MAG: hypothetical protein LBK95_09580 [Bifidobacteriaceae bacterium]|jgi:hypothetical protein|nr:hypothetical protein [Bifidobacteriaceae bacterium]